MSKDKPKTIMVHKFTEREVLEALGLVGHNVNDMYYRYDGSLVIETVDSYVKDSDKPRHLNDGKRADWVEEMRR